jgi:Reverse transcriptase (RNA-dependent DNA polymerase)
LEKVITKRILHDIGALSLVPTNQFGARPHSSTIHAGLALTHDIALAHARGGCCGSLQFDIQGFFDNINHGRLLHCFRLLGFAEAICKWLSSFLANRSVQLRLNGAVSDPIDILVGAPQGSPISPILSVIYTFPLLRLANKWSDANMYMYVDDGNILAWGPSYRLVTNTLTRHFADCLGWLKRAGLTIESSKTEVIFYSLTRARPHIHGPRPSSITLPSDNNGTVTITSSKNVRYLGLFIDHKLTWHHHVKVMATRACRTLKALHLLGNSIHGLDHGNWRLAYNAICLPILTYGSPIWYKGQKQLTKLLQDVQNDAVRWIVGAFCSTPTDPLHQLIAILPIDLCLQMLSKTAALTLLTVPHSSQLIQRLGPPWCNPLECNDGHTPLPFPIPNTPLIRLANLAPAQARRPANYKHGPWTQLLPNNNHLHLLPDTPRGEDRKWLTESIIHATRNAQDATLLIFCQGSSPSLPAGNPVSVATCVAWLKGRETGHLTQNIGEGADTADAAIEAMILAVNLIDSITTQQPNITNIKIYSTDAHVPKMCSNRSHRDLSPRLFEFSLSITNLLNRLPTTQITVSWAPITKGLLPARRLKAIAAALAQQTPNLPPPPPSKAHLRSLMRKEAISQWQTQWRDSPKLQPAYLALSSPPDGKLPPFIQGLTSFSRPIFTTGVRLLTGHAFTGEYNARHRPQSHDPHSCQCGEPLQTAHHIIAACPAFTAARRRHFYPLSPFTSLSIIFGTKEGGATLGAFLAETQACMQPRRQEPPPEDHR